MMKRRGFTIIELILVIGIISVLITVSTTAIVGSIRSARRQRASALCTLVEQGIAAYYAQKDEWPVEPGEPKNNDAYYEFTSGEVREAIRKVVLEIRNDNPLIDVSGLFVATSDGDKARGMDFMDAVRGTKRHPERVRVSQMYFGYPEAESGYFRCFKMRYYPNSDTIKVMQ